MRSLPGVRLWPLLLLAVASSAAGKDPSAFLERERGLTRHAGGTVWISRTERQVREHLARLDEARAAILTLQAALEERRQRNAAAWAASRDQIAALQKAKAALPTDDPKRKQLDRQIAEIQAQAIDPAQLAGLPDVQTRLIELTRLRLRLTVATLTLRDQVPQLDSDYRRLSQDAEVTAALEQLGPGHRLGPLHANYRAELQRLGEYERVVLTPWVPLYLQHRHARVGALLGERTPATFTWEAEQTRVVLTAGLAEAAGLTVPAAAPTVPLTFAKNRRLAARQITVPALRLGKFLFRDLPACVLPPEGEDLGARIGPAALPKHRAGLEPDQLRLVLSAE